MPLLARAMKGLALSLRGPEAAERASWFSGLTRSGVNVKPADSMRAVAVYSATSLIAQSIAPLPVRFLLRDDKARIPQRPERVRALWGRPNLDQTRIAFYETVVLSMLLWGNFYGFPRRNNRLDVIEVWPLDPDRIRSIDRDEDGGLVFDVTQHGLVHNRVGQPVNMLHIPLLTLPGRIKGLSPIEQAMETIGLTKSAEEHAARFLGDGVHMSGVIEAPAVENYEQAKELQESFGLMHAGTKKAGSIGVLTGGAKFTTLAIPPAELQFLEQMKYSDRKIASLYRVPPHLVADVERSTSWGTGISDQQIQFLVHTILPLIARIEQAVEDAFLGGTNLQMRFVLNGLMRAAAAERATFYVNMRNAGVFSANDIRELEDLSPLDEGGDVYLQPSNMIRLTEAPAPQQEGAA